MQPHRTIDPVVMAAHIVVRLQSIVSREINPTDISVLTVGSLQAGQTENVIADTAEIGVDTRSVRPETREQLLVSIRRVVDAECQASGATVPPKYTITRHFPVLNNDGKMLDTLTGPFKTHFGDKFNPETAVTTISEDFPILATSQGKPCLFWHWGGIEASFWDEKAAKGTTMRDVPANHTSNFAPVMGPTMRTGIDAFVIAALTFFKERV
jgi:metal-dependent amidase/aminoacylase/carboxypeptidase family protein